MNENQNLRYEQNNYPSYHTLEFTLRLTGYEYSHVYEKLCLKGQYRKRKYKNCKFIDSFFFRDRGVRIVLKSCKGQYQYYSISLIVNPRKAIMDDSPIGIFEISKENVRKLTIFLNHVLKQIGFEKINFTKCYDSEYLEYGEAFNIEQFTYDSFIHHFKLSRIDLCINHRFETEELADLYLKLMKRGKHPKFLKPSTHYDKESRQRIPYENELRYSADCFDFVVYNKQAQMLDEKNRKYYKVIPEEAKGLLRFEIQMSIPKINYILKTHPEYNRHNILSKLSEVCCRQFEMYTKKLFCAGRYYKLDLARELVLGLNPKNKNRIVEFLNDISVSRSLEDTIKNYTALGKPYKGILKQLEGWNINPVTIPRRYMCPHFGLPSIPRILELTPPKHTDDLAGEHKGIIA